MSLENKMLIMLTAGSISLIACGDNNENDNTVKDSNIADVNLKHGLTNSAGRKSFQDDQVQGNTADLVITDESSNLLPDVNILYADGDGFEMFLLEKQGYEPQLQIAKHNSIHEYSLTNSPLQFVNHNQSEKEQSFVGADMAFSWSKHWEKTGCYNREELCVVMKPGAYLIKKGASYLTVGVSDTFVVDLAESLNNELDENHVVEMRSLIPSKYGMYGLTTITTIEIRTGNCNEPEQTPYDPQCEGTIFCDQFEEYTLDKWLVEGDIKFDDGWIRMNNANIINKNTINFCESIIIDYKSGGEGNYGLFLGNEIALYGSKPSNNLQFVCGSNGKDIYQDLEINQTNKIELSNNQLTVNGNSITCNNKPSFVNFSSGTNSELNLDYVEVRCK